MLVLTRRVKESLRVDADDITVTVLRVRGDQVRFRISSARDLGVYREEIVNELSRAAKHALGCGEVAAWPSRNYFAAAVWINARAH